MTLVLSDMETEVMEHLGLDATDLTGPWTTDRIDLLINESWGEIQNNYPFKEKETTASFTTTAGAFFYQIPSAFEALRLISIEDLNDFSHKPLNRITVHAYESKYVNITTERDKPTMYVREDKGIRLLPTPDNIYNMKLKYDKILSDLSITNATPDTPQVWHEVIVYGAVWRGFARLGDYARSTASQRIQAMLISKIKPVEAKEERDTHLGGLDVAWESSDDGSSSGAKLDAFGDPLRP